VRDEQVVAREGEEPRQHPPERRRPPELVGAQAREPLYRARQGDSRVHQRLEGVDELQPLHADRADLADPVALRGEARRLQVEDDERRLVEQRVARLAGEGDGRATADDAAVAGGDVREQRDREPLGDRARGEQRPGRFDRRERPRLLERLDQAVEGVQRQLHPADLIEHMFAWQAGASALGRVPLGAEASERVQHDVARQQK
jgi:hypothetical protein